MTWEPGAVVLDRYRLEERVGAGGMGEVWRAEHVGVGSRVAMKTLLPATRSSREMMARFKREAYFLGRIQSDHVARVLDFIEDEHWGLLLVMDFVEGDKLANVLAERGKLGVEETIDLGVDLASALCDLHRANVVHRDLKPANVILRPLAGGGRRATVVDFGLSRLFSSEPQGDAGDEITGITQANMALGTVEYMAPEQVLNSREATASSDLYALGAILFRCASGQHAFGDLRDGHLAHAKITRDAPPLVTGRTDAVARGLEQIVAQALRKKPGDRYERVDLVLAELATLRELARMGTSDVESTDTEDGQPFDARATARMPLATGVGSESISKLSESRPVAPGTISLSSLEEDPPTLDPATMRFKAREAAKSKPTGASETGVEAPASTFAAPPPHRGVSGTLAAVVAAAALAAGFAAGRWTAPERDSVATGPVPSTVPAAAAESASAAATATAAPSATTTASPATSATAAAPPVAVANRVASPTAPQPPRPLPVFRPAPATPPAAPRPTRPLDDPYQ